MKSKPRLNETMTRQADRYIEDWQKRCEAAQAQVVMYGDLPAGARFILPGGLTCQIKLNEVQAGVGTELIRYAPWEQVVPVQQ
jgi:hypothetical protein